MIQLIKLEFTKWKFSSFLRSLLITTAILVLLIIPPLFYDGNIPKTPSEVLVIIDAITRLTYTIFSGVLLARIVIDEYQDQTMQLLFTYPIPRRKLLIAKLILTIGITFLCLFLSKVLIWILITVLNKTTTFLPYPIWGGMSAKYLITATALDLSTSCLCLIALFFGMMKKSSRATIVASIIISFLINGNFGDISLGVSLMIPAIVSGIGLAFAYVTLRNIEVKDFG